MKRLLVAALLLWAPPATAQQTDPADLAFWQSIQAGGSPAEYAAYLQAFPNGRFAALARIRAGGQAAPPPSARPTPVRPVGPLPTAPAAAPAPAVAAGPAGTIDAMALSKEAAELRRAGMFARYRGKTVTVSGRFQKFTDLAVGDHVSFEFIQPQERFTPRMAIQCSFPRRDTRTYDTFATMEIGAAVVVQAQIFDVGDVFNFVELKPCKVIQPALHAAGTAAASPDGPAWPPNGSYTCTIYGGNGVGTIKILDRATYADPDGKRGRYSFDQASGRIEFGNGIWGDSYVGWYSRPGSPASGAANAHPTIEIAPGATPTNKTIHCPLQ